jgi:hypothetical protein
LVILRCWCVYADGLILTACDLGVAEGCDERDAADDVAEDSAEEEGGE